MGLIKELFRMTRISITHAIERKWWNFEDRLFGAVKTEENKGFKTIRYQNGQKEIFYSNKKSDVPNFEHLESKNETIITKQYQGYTKTIHIINGKKEVYITKDEEDEDEPVAIEKKMILECPFCGEKLYESDKRCPYCWKRIR